jgi:peptidoglycan/xylan/chitin deacetylase (PgdA/CDA1 family)
MYHAVEAEPREPKYKHFYVTAPEFRAQMRYLKGAGYEPIDFETLEYGLAGVRALPEKPVVLTFDDGYENLLAHADPLLREFGWPYTVFLVSDLVGARNEWVVPEGYEPTPLLSWDQIHEMAQGGSARFQPHTATHANLARQPEAVVRDQIARCRRRLEDTLQKPMRYFCYPYGGYNDRVVSIAREEGMTMAVTTDFGRVRPGDDPLRLPRISVYHVPPVSLTYGIGSLNFRWRLSSRKDTRTAPAA